MPLMKADPTIYCCFFAKIVHECSLYYLALKRISFLVHLSWVLSYPGTFIILTMAKMLLWIGITMYAVFIIC